MQRTARPGIFVLLAVGLVAAGCGEDTPSKPSGLPIGSTAPDFSIRDVNPNSPSHNELVSPRDYKTKVSAWYFGVAT